MCECVCVCVCVRVSVCVYVTCRRVENNDIREMNILLLVLDFM